MSQVLGGSIENDRIIQSMHQDLNDQGDTLNAQRQSAAHSRQGSA